MEHKPGTLIVFGNIDFTSDNSEAIVNEVHASYVISSDKDPNQVGEEYMGMFNYNSYIIPQKYEGRIIWKQ